MTHIAYILRSTSQLGKSKETTFHSTEKTDMKEVLESHNNGSHEKTRKGGPFQCAVWIEGLQKPTNLAGILDSPGHHHDYARFVPEAQKEIGKDDPKFPTHTEARVAKIILAVIKAIQQKQEDGKSITVHLIQPLPKAFLFDITKHCKLVLDTEHCPWANSPRPTKVYTDAQKAAIEKAKKRKGMDEKTTNADQNTDIENAKKRKGMEGKTYTADTNVDDAEVLADLAQMLTDAAALARNPKADTQQLATNLSIGAKIAGGISRRLIDSRKCQKT